MKKLSLMVISVICLSSLQSFARSGDLELEIGPGFSWDGKTISQNQVCEKFGGRGVTPPIQVTNIPESTNQLRVLFSDETYALMNNGGHGIIRFSVSTGSQSLTLQQIPGEVDINIPGVEVEQNHLATDWSGTGGAYLPPCSGGSGNTYAVKIQALDKQNNVLSEGRIVLGVY